MPQILEHSYRTNVREAAVFLCPVWKAKTPSSWTGGVRSRPQAALASLFVLFQSWYDPSGAESIPRGGVWGEGPREGSLAAPDLVSHTTRKGPYSTRISSPQNGPVSTCKSLPIMSTLQKPLITSLVILQLLKNVLLLSRLGSRLGWASGSPSLSHSLGTPLHVHAPCHSLLATVTFIPANPPRKYSKQQHHFSRFPSWKPSHTWHEYNIFPCH